MPKNKVKKIKTKPLPHVNRTSGHVSSTQRFLPFREIRDGLAVMKDSSLRSVILVSSLNFSLKSEDEQRGIIQGYVSFLNALDFELQIVVQSRKLNVENYLLKLQQVAQQQTNELLRKQTLSYRAYVAKLVQEADIMDKKFFVVVPYSPANDKKKKGYWTRLREVVTPVSGLRLSQEKFEKYAIEMSRRVAQVVSSLRSIGLEAKPLDTEALIELYYNTYNPVIKQRRQVGQIENLQIDWTAE